MGRPSPLTMLEEMTYWDLLHWQAQWQKEPWGEAQADLRAGVVASAALAPWSKNPPKPSTFFRSLREAEKNSGWIEGPDMVLALRVMVA